MKLRLALLFTLIAIATHYYLTHHYYELALGLSAGDAFCNVNQTFNCDAASASRFAEFLGVPLAAWGAGANTVLLFLIFGWMIGWTENLRFHSYITFYFAALIAVISVVMGIVSIVFLGQYCLYCILIYIMSFLTFELLRRSLGPNSESPAVNLKRTITQLFSGEYIKTYGLILIAAPVLAFFLDQALLKQYGVKEMGQMVNASVADWKAAPQLNFDVPAAFIEGSEDSKFVITEFADFLCVHCKNASPSIKAFLNTHPDAKLQFYNFPLDGTCNEGLPAHGVSCYLASAVICAENLKGSGNELHAEIFEAQEKLASQSLAVTKKTVTDKAKALGIEQQSFETCVASPETMDLVKKQAELGRRVNVRGTPTFFVNGKKLNRAQSLPVLEKAYSEIQK